uniref:cAMP-dependent protein kinase inhibitor beta n=1 Tax=Cyprinus carpio TaxID=7962 RepID=A0A8C2D6L2_CYPCA
LQTESWKMTDVEPVVSDFEATGRTGRRNALPDILGSTAGPGAADLPDKLAELSVGDFCYTKNYITVSTKILFSCYIQIENS